MKLKTFARRAAAAGAVLAALTLAALPALAAPKVQVSTTDAVADHADILSDETEQYVNDVSIKLSDACGAQIGVYTLDELLGSTTMEGFAYDVFNAWGLGSDDLDNGVLLLLARYKASTFDELFDGVYSVPWEDLLPTDAAFPVTGSSLDSQLSSVPACQSIIKKAVVKRLMAKHHTSVLPESGTEYKIRFMLRKNVCEIMLDTTGEGLHKRGYRRNAMEAPIRETLAATIADLGRVRRDSLVEDPFCGSGTLLIEAAQKAMNIAPGLKRRFAAERYSFVPAAVWAEQRQKALAESKLDVGFEAFGYDIDPAAVALANANAKLAGVEKRCHFEVADVADFAAKQEAIVLTNPPYGERMSTIEGAAKLARTLGRQMEANPCAGVYAITADMDFETHYGKRANKRRKMYNGMIPCQLYMYYNAPKFEHTAKPMPKSGFDGKRRFDKKD